MEDWAMKKIIWFALVIVFALSCKQEVPETIEGEVGGSKPVVTFKALLPDTKTELSAKDGDVWHNYWSVGDAISVNGIASGALAAEDGFVGTGIAEFNVEGSLSAPYNFGYPASAITGYSDGSATVTIPASQSYVAGKYDSSAYIMLGRSSDADALEFVPMMALLQITPTAPTEGSLTVKGIRVEAIGGEKMSGRFTTDFGAISGGEYSFVELNPDSPISFGAPVLIAIPAQNYASGVRIVITASDDTSMTFSKQSAFDVEASKLYPIAAPAFVPSSVTLHNVYVNSTSSVSVRWFGSNASNNKKKTWRIHVYSNEDCSSEHSSYTIPANTDCWKNEDQLTFVIGGLEQGTKYWFKVEDVLNGIMSDAKSATTMPFEVVEMPSSIGESSVGNTIFAEDFSELKWGQEGSHSSGGFIPEDTSNFNNYSTDGATFIYEETTAMVGFRRTDFDAAFKASRLDKWLSESSVFIHPGFLKLGTSSSSGFVITPEFPIEDGKVATVNVTVNASKYNKDCSDNWTVAVIKSVKIKTPATRESDFAWMDINNPLMYQEVTVNSTSWMDATAKNLQLEKGDRIVFGRARNGSNASARVFLNSIKVDLSTLENKSQIEVSIKQVTSSTVTVEWTEGDITQDKARAYTAQLYNNADCSGNAVRSFDFESNASYWSTSYAPRFVFTGLEQNTLYYVRIKDNTNNYVSNIIPVRTSIFTVKTMPEVINETGLAFAEDFSECCWNSDYINSAVGIDPQSGTTMTTQTPLDNSDPYDSVRPAIWWQLFKQSARSTSRLANWKYDAEGSSRDGNAVTSIHGAENQADGNTGRPVMVGPGYLQLGTMREISSGKYDCAKAWIMTPPFSFEEGKVATVSVSITAATPSSQTTKWVIAVTNSGTDYSYGWLSFSFKSKTDTDYYQKVTLSNAFDSYTKTLKLEKGDMIVIGPSNDFSNPTWRDNALTLGSSKSALDPIMMLSDITVDVTEIQDKDATSVSVGIEP